MARTRSGVANAIGNRDQEPQPQVVEQVPVVGATLEPMTMAGVQAMIRAMLAKQSDEMRQMLHDNRDEPIIPLSLIHI